MNKKAVILLSGGLDSATVLAIAKSDGYQCYALSFNYGQRHLIELEASKRIAATHEVFEHRIIKLPLGEFGGSALTDTNIDIPDYSGEEVIPVTYVPARNTIFLAYALSWAETLNAYDIFIGASAIDYSGYPDCRPEYMEAFQHLANLGTKDGVEGKGFNIHTPLINLSKAETVQTGLQLGVDYSMTISCYQADEQGRACGHCDSCVLRKKGFTEAGVEDPTHYHTAEAL